MKIIIAGAGDVGFHLAELLSHEHQDIVLIDINQDVLDYAATHLDVLTVHGDASSISKLEEAEVSRAKLVLAVTTSEKTNLVTAILAKRMGAKKTIARVKNSEYLKEEQRNTFCELGIDNLISPQELAAEEIVRLIGQCSFTDLFEFENGKFNLVGVTLDAFSPLSNKLIREVKDIETDITLKPIAILRGHQTIMPTSETLLRPNDHVYFITRRENISRLETFVGIEKRKVKKVMIVGGTDIAYATARQLEEHYQVTLIDESKERAKRMAETLDHTLVIIGNASNIGLMEEEGLNYMDAFVALTPNSETNIIASLTAKNHGVYKTIAQVENREYVHLSQDIGVDTLINKKLIAASNIFRYVRKGQIEALTRLHGVDAEVIEYIVHKKNQLTRKPLNALPLPKTALIGGVIRGEETLIPNEDFQLNVDDRVIFFALPEAIGKLEQLFH